MPKVRDPRPTAQQPETTDPQPPSAEFLRAIANPVRLAMLQYLAVQGPATATVCGGVAGVSATAASYHLRLLARHGIVEEVASGDRRERPWRLLAVPEVSLPTSADMEKSAAIAQFLAAADSRDNAVVAEYEIGSPDVPSEWRNDIRIQNILKLSLDEFRELRSHLREALQPYQAAASREAPESQEERFVYVAIRVVPWVRAEFAREGKSGVDETIGTSAASTSEESIDIAAAASTQSAVLKR